MTSIRGKVRITVDLNVFKSALRIAWRPWALLSTTSTRHCGLMRSEVTRVASSTHVPTRPSTRLPGTLATACIEHVVSERVGEKRKRSGALVFVCLLSNSLTGKA